MIEDMHDVYMCTRKCFADNRQYNEGEKRYMIAGAPMTNCNFKVVKLYKKPKEQKAKEVGN